MKDDYQFEGQITWDEILNPDTWSGKTYQTFSSNKGEDFRVVLEETARITKKDAIIPGLEGDRNGDRPDVSWETDGASLGEYTMRSFGECPREEKESRLSQILEDNPPQRYSLSEKACLGILRRAKNRGKELPEQLEEALKRQASIAYRGIASIEQTLQDATEEDGEKIRVTH